MLTFRKWLNSRTGRDENGFSLLELVVAVGVILILTVIGMISYTGLTHNARVAAVESAAEMTYKAALAAEAAGGAMGDFGAVENNWNASQDQTEVSINRDADGRICVSAVFLNNDDVPDAHRGIGGACGENGENAGNGGENDGTGGENSGDAVSMDAVISFGFYMSNADAFSSGVISTLPPSECSEEEMGVSCGMRQNVSLSAFRVIDRTTNEVIASAADLSGTGGFHADYIGEYDGTTGENYWITTGTGAFYQNDIPITIVAPSMEGLLLSIELDTPNGSVFTYDLPTETVVQGQDTETTLCEVGRDENVDYVWFIVSN